MAQSKVINERKEAVNQLKVNFKYLTDTDQAWKDLNHIMQDNDLNVRTLALESLITVYASIPDNYKVHAWEDLKQYINKPHIDSLVLNYIVEVFGCSFSSLPDDYKVQAWQDLIRLTQDSNNDMRRNLVVTLYLALEHIPSGHKEQAWRDYDLFAKYCWTAPLKWTANCR